MRAPLFAAVSRRSCDRRVMLPVAVLGTCVLLLLATGNLGAHATGVSRTQQALTVPGVQVASAAAGIASGGNSSYRVPVTLYVMSRCPGGCGGCACVSQQRHRSSFPSCAPAPDANHTDAMFCQHAFKPVLETLPSTALVATQYIARLTQGDSEVACMHGDDECTGNKLQLCMQASVPASDNRRFYQALLCHSQGGVSDVQRLQTCMTEAGLSADAVAATLQCVSATQGASLAVASAKDVVANGVKKSCTVFIGGTKRCVRDGGR
jgi:hypothetical protein